MAKRQLINPAKLVGLADRLFELYSRPIMIHICRDGTISYRDASKNEPIFNGVALPVFSVNTVEEAQTIQVVYGRRQYVQHPDNGMDWYKISKLEDGSDPASRSKPLLEYEDLDGISRMFEKFYHEEMKR